MNIQTKAFRGKGNGIYYAPNILYEQRKLFKKQAKDKKEQQIENANMENRIATLETMLKKLLESNE